MIFQMVGNVLFLESQERIIIPYGNQYHYMTRGALPLGQTGPQRHKVIEICMRNIFFSICKCLLQKIGKNATANYGKEIAFELQLPQPNAYTAHCWRRTAATHLADAGCSLTEIKAVTGHVSDKVAQQYIDRSEVLVEYLCAHSSFCSR